MNHKLTSENKEGSSEMNKKVRSPKKTWLALITASLFATPVLAHEIEERNLTGAVDYYIYALKSGESLPNKDDVGIAGITRLTLNYKAFEEDSGDTGAFQLRVDHKHGYTDSTPSELVMGNIGGFGLIQPGFSDIGLRLANLYWAQTFNNRSTDMMVGFLDSTDYLDTYGLGSPYSGFSNLQFSTGSGTIRNPDESTFGIYARHMLSDNYYASISISDAKADSTKPFDGVENFFSDHQHFKSLELGWVESKDAFYMKNSHLTVWHSDGIADKPVDNIGATWSTIHHMGNWIPFLRAGISKGPDALYKSSVVVGTGYTGLGKGTLGIAFGWAQPNAPLDEVYNSEIYYRMNWGPVSLTPNLQYISPLQANSEADHAFIVGLRGNVKFSF